MLPLGVGLLGCPPKIFSTDSAAEGEGKEHEPFYLAVASAATLGAMARTEVVPQMRWAIGPEAVVPLALLPAGSDAETEAPMPSVELSETLEDAEGDGTPFCWAHARAVVGPRRSTISSSSIWTGQRVQRCFCDPSVVTRPGLGVCACAFANSWFGWPFLGSVSSQVAWPVHARSHPSYARSSMPPSHSGFH